MGLYFFSILLVEACAQIYFLREEGSIICRIFAPIHALSWLWGSKKRQMTLLNFLIFFLFSDAQPDFSGTFHQDFSHIAQAWWIPVADLSLNQVYIYITFEHIIKLNTQPKQHEFLHVYICYWYTFLTQKLNLTNWENSLNSWLHHKRRDP